MIIAVNCKVNQEFAIFIIFFDVFFRNYAFFLELCDIKTKNNY